MYFYPTFNTHDTLSISFCFSSSVICTYRFIVMPILECPSIFCNVLGIIPPSIHLVAKVCLNTCMENLLISALSHILNNAVSYALFFTGSPLRLKKIKSDHSSCISLMFLFFSFCAISILTASSVNGIVR